MGLFDRKNAKNTNNNLGESSSEENLGRKFPFVTVVIEDVLSMTSVEVSAIGNVHGGSLKPGDTLYILGRKGKSIKTSVVRIEDTLMAKMSEATDGMNVSIVLEGVRQNDVLKYDVLSTVDKMPSDVETGDSIVNPYLSGLLRESKNFQKEREFMGRLLECIAEEATLLTPCMRDQSDEGDESKVGYALLKATDGNMYLSAFTDAYEMDSLAGLPEKRSEPIKFDKIMTIMERTPAAGLLINPAHEGFAMKKEMIQSISLQKRKIENNVRDQKINTNQPVGIAIPKDDHIPTELFSALSEYMKTEPSILRAWYGVMFFPKEKDSKMSRSHLIIIDTLEETPEIFGAIGRTARPLLDELPLNMQAASKVGNMTEKLMLFYERNDELKV